MRTTSLAGIDTDPSNRFRAKSTTITTPNPKQYNTPLFMTVFYLKSDAKIQKNLQNGGIKEKLSYICSLNIQ